MLDPKETLS
jgi:hypothetical protein